MKRVVLRRPYGVALIVGLLMLFLITLMVTAAFTLSMGNLKSVGNMQFRNESIAAANKAIEQVIDTNFASGFMTVPSAQTISFDIDKDSNAEYSVVVDAPVCIQSTVVAGSQTTGQCSSVSLQGFSCAAPTYSTLWDIEATVTDAVSGTSVRVRQGVRIELTEAQRNAVCPP